MNASSTVAMLTVVDNTQQDTNIETAALDKKQVLKRAGILGKAEGQGSNSRPGLFIATVEAAKARVVTKDDVAPIWTAFMHGLREKQGVGYVPLPSEKQQVSKLAVAVRVGELPQIDPMELMNRVVDAQRKLREAHKDGKLDMSPFDGLVAVSRAQVSMPDTLLTKDQVEALLMKPVADLPIEADRLERILKAIEKVCDDTEEPVSKESREVLIESGAGIMTRIRELGGSTAMRKEEERQQAKIDKARSNLAALASK
jgi:hypothetical protein